MKVIVPQGRRASIAFGESLEEVRQNEPGVCILLYSLERFEFVIGYCIVMFGGEYLCRDSERSVFVFPNQRPESWFSSVPFPQFLCSLSDAEYWRPVRMSYDIPDVAVGGTRQPSEKAPEKAPEIRKLLEDARLRG